MTLESGIWALPRAQPLLGLDALVGAGMLLALLPAGV